MRVISGERARCNNNNDDVNLDTEYLYQQRQRRIGVRVESSELFKICNIQCTI